jgi:aryl-alcohol dehydrogenase-like predicted oxidoreductase
MSSITLGTYSIHGSLDSVVQEAFAKGCRIIDTAPNYRHGQAQQELAQAFKNALDTGTLNFLEEIRVFSKVGFFSAQRGADFHKQGLISAEDATAGHSLNLAYVRTQVLKNLEELDLPLIDTLFLHNPEKRFTLETPEKALQQIQLAFEVLEDFCSQGLMKGYGVATWSGFEEQNAPPLFTLSEILKTARKVCTNHHFRAIQLPLSLVKLDAVAAYFKKRGPLYTAIQEGIEVFGSSPLHVGQLPPFVNKALLQRIEPSLTPAQACLLFAKSIPGVNAVFTSPSSLEQLTQSLEVSSMSPLSEDTLQGLVQLLQQRTRVAS